MIDHDELTNLSNRRRMLKDIEEFRRTGDTWGYILFDVNLFKQVNDEYGHNEGDHALSIVASVLEAASLNNNAKAYADDAVAVLQSLKDKGYQIVNSKGLPSDSLTIDMAVGDPVIKSRLGFLINVGLDYLTLSFALHYYKRCID